MTSAIKALAYKPYGRNPEETKQGFPVYSGDPAEFHHWDFKTKLREKCADPDNPGKTIQLLIDSLRGDALDVAYSLGVDQLTADGVEGIRRLRVVCESMSSRS